MVTYDIFESHKVETKSMNVTGDVSPENFARGLGVLLAKYATNLKIHNVDENRSELVRDNKAVAVVKRDGSQYTLDYVPSFLGNSSAPLNLLSQYNWNGMNAEDVRLYSDNLESLMK